MTEVKSGESAALMDLVVPIHGQIEMNRIFFETLSRNTRSPFRLIVVDNFSQDESASYFESQRAKGWDVTILRNPHNQCYPFSINQGVRAGDASIVGFLNNDILVGPGWDEPLIKALIKDGYPVVSPGGLEHFPDPKLEEIFFQRWRYINKRWWSQSPTLNLEEKIRRMYGNFDETAKRIQKKYDDVHYPGIMGHCHLLKRETFERLGGLDPRIQSADWDLFLTVERMKREGIFEKSPMIFGGSYVHHFIRLTDANVKRVPPVCAHAPHMTLEEKWEKREIQELWPFKDQVPDGQKSLSKKIFKKYVRGKTGLYYWRVGMEKII
jgi:glycosyltransferase involved in cell wall biosynthesis